MIMVASAHHTPDKAPAAPKAGGFSLAMDDCGAGCYFSRPQAAEVFADKWVAAGLP